MEDNEQRTNQQEGVNLKSYKSVKIIVTLAVLLAAAFFTYYKLINWHKHKVDTAVKKEQRKWREKSSQLEQEISSLQKELATFRGQDASEEKLAAVFGDSKETSENSAAQSWVSSPAATRNPSFADIEQRIMAFFRYLDEQPYVQAFHLAGGTYHQWEIAVARLSAKPPIVAGETDSLYNLVRNVAHFYRVLGKKRMLLIKQILQNESAVIEPAMRIFYRWFSTDAKGRARLRGRPSLQTQYIYAGYLLNTLGGRSYLLRRGSRVRTLTTYYCVLMLDRANDAQLNSAGIDIRPYIRVSANEISNQLGLRYQDEYLARLDRLSRKYT